VLLGSDGSVGEFLEAGDERAAEALETVAMGGDGGVLAEIEVLADLFGSMDAVVEVGDERGYSLLEVNVVLPERVVGVYKEGLAGCKSGSYAGHFSRSRHTFSIGGCDSWLA
jgi:hypothetical protein